MVSPNKNLRNPVNTQANQVIQKIVQLINARHMEQALKLLTPLLATNKKNSQLWHLKSVIHHAKGELSLCEQAINKSLAINPNFLPSLVNLAKLKKQQGKVEDAIGCYLKIIALSPKDINALFHIGVLYNQTKRYTQAQKQLTQALQLAPADNNICIALGQSLMHQDLLIEASKCFKDVLSRQETNIAALNNLALIQKQQCLFSKAINTLLTALKYQPQQIEVMKNLASCYTLNGEVMKSKQLYQSVLEQNPEDIEAHHWLNTMLWEHDDNDFLKSYQLALKSNQNNLDLQFALAKKMQLSEDINGATQQLKDILFKNKKHGPSLLELGTILREQGLFEESYKHIEQAHKINQSNEVVKQELAKSLMGIGEPKKALSILNKLLLKNPHQQGWWAYKTIALKLLNSPEYHYLCNYEQFILKASIEVPQGYANLNEFNCDLVNELKKIHYAKSHPLEQTLKNGSQTSEKLFDYHLPLIKTLTASLKQQTSEFLQQLPQDDKHPLLSRNTGRFVETDSWSVILNSSGFHQDHYHPAGWFSSCYYAQVPDMVETSELQQGWIKFGQPGFNLPQTIEPACIIKPETGLLVQFPSYFWHGTNAFVSEEKRITTPYDILPV
ncbi:tetratricopeptide repeat protein [Thalassomonas sp. M1454]|uniref:tetratricopeptide repeat protein n=1 Tax=Thalassomonas sp. M1454 TaxID=2594477 RepID=UPI00117EEF5B|nr:tetratricopeptide repeat protein [Thalassomonas sp. M1454]TRX57233.1 tetratricopeptide repeat protein [Thalassomonas sp. M1454]